MKPSPLDELRDWINTVQGWNDGLKRITQNVDFQLRQFGRITTDEGALDAMVELLFIRNRLDHIVNFWVNNTTEDGPDAND